MLTFTIRHQTAAVQHLKSYRCEYDDFHRHVGKLLQIADGQEYFIYTIPNDFSAHMRLCHRLLNGMFDRAESTQTSFTVNVRVYHAADFMTPDSGTTQQIPVTVIPKVANTCRNKYQKGYSKGSNQGNLTSSHVVQSSNYAPPQHFISNTSSQTPANLPARPAPAQPSAPVKSKHAAAIDSFFTTYKVAGNTSEYNVMIETNNNLSAPAEHKSGDNYSVSLLLKATGTANIGKDFSLCKIAGNGTPPSFSLPLLKPLVQRTISISIDFGDQDESSFWAVKQTSTGQWIGTVIAFTVLKIQKKIFVRTVDFAEATKLMEGLRWQS